MPEHEDRIHPHLVALHWTMALCIAGAVAAILVRQELPAGHGWKPLLRQTHLLLGQLVLALVLLRLALRLKHGVPQLPGLPAAARWAGHAVHLLLYVVMLSQPVTGVLMQQSGGKDIVWWGWALPHLVPDDSALHSELKALHQDLGLVFYGLLGLHITAALVHHFVLRNNTLRRMLGRPTR